MKNRKKFLTITAVIIIISILLKSNDSLASSNNMDYCQRTPVRAALFAKDLTDDYIVNLKNRFEEIQKNNIGSIIFTFYDAKFNKSIQNADIDKVLNSGIDLIFLDIVDINNLKETLNKIFQYNIPVIVFNREPSTVDIIKSNKKVLLVGTDSQQGGIIEGKIIADAWYHTNKSFDKNKDDILQYVMLVGEKFNETSVNRSKYSISTINDAGIKTQELAAPILNWNTDNAKKTVEALLLKYGNKIEAIISNDDSMAIGAVLALQTYGYNTGDKSKSVPVVGIDGFPEAIDLISKGFMLGTAKQDPNLADVMYQVGLNLINDRNPAEGIPYKLDETGIAIRVPFKEYTGQL